MTEPAQTETKDTEKRFAIIVGQEIQDALNKVAKEHKISQSAVVQVLFANSDLKALEPKFKAKRDEKINSRGSKAAVLNKIKNLSPEQLEKLLASLPA